MVLSQLPPLDVSVLAGRLAMSYPPRKDYGGTQLFGDTGNAMSRFHSHFAEFVDQQVSIYSYILICTRILPTNLHSRSVHSRTLHSCTPHSCTLHSCTACCSQTPRKERKKYLNKIKAGVIAPSLPPGWVQCYDQQSGQKYFHHHHKGYSQWEDPSRVEPVTNQAYQVGRVNPESVSTASAQRA